MCPGLNSDDSDFVSGQNGIRESLTEDEEDENVVIEFPKGDGEGEYEFGDGDIFEAPAFETNLDTGSVGLGVEKQTYAWKFFKGSGSCLAEDVHHRQTWSDMYDLSCKVQGRQEVVCH
ncbi:hypothetical protein L1987_38139 [Smallanthus sonchifolius]|uniref:Uncharacterized protein n=1 Tax=Smallanthus sonchifolius TaxID=185202 RepID=A0ACB9HIE1_9ASTR|nr:hypothetical protein L1987_38139 [Smallanthus sonchifolius]